MQASSAHDFFNVEKRPLDVLFRPNSVAVIGATERKGSVGRTLVANLIGTTFGGTIYPVNPTRKSVLGIRAYPSLADIPDQVELAVIVVPARVVPAVMQECVDHGVRGAIVISAGFKEIGPEGVELERRVLEIARSGNIRIIGPNCLGVMSPLTGLNATFAQAMALPGSVGFISQSGAMCTAILDWSHQENVGFSAFVSIGSMLDVDWGDLITYLGDDPRTNAIVIYMESIGNARSFMSAAREVALTKPIIVIKPGRTKAAAAAAASHTGSLTGSDEVLDAAFRRCGVLRVNDISDLFNMAELLGKQPPKGSKLTIVTNAGGPGVLATDALLGSGAELTPLSPEIHAKLDEILPSHWSHANPIDILGDATRETYAKVVEIAANDPESDGLLVILSPQAMTDPTSTAENLARARATLPKNKPILASWMGGADVAAGARILNQANISTFPYPDTAARMFSYMWQASKNLKALYETPHWGAEMHPDRERVGDIISHVRESGRTILTEYESKRVMDAYGIPTVQTVVADSAEKAAAIAEQIGFPVVVKINSETITHKSDVGGVKLNLRTPAAVEAAYLAIESAVAAKYRPSDFAGVTVQPMLDLSEAYELILGASPDPQFGPVILFGTGGILVEVYKDRSLGLPPLNTNLAHRMMRRTKVYEALQGVRGRKAVDMDGLESLMVNFSHLVAEQRWIKEIDINPLLVSADTIIALDARIILYDEETREEALPQLAIRPYPAQYEQVWQTEKGNVVGIRPIMPEDEHMMIEFHKKLSEDSVYMRYFSNLKLTQRIAHDRLIRVCHIDYDREMVLIATHRLADGTDEVIAAGRLSSVHGRKSAEYSLLVADEFQGHGIGTKLLNELIRIGKDEGLETIEAYMLRTNSGIIKISERLGFKIKPEDDVLHAVLNLNE